MQYKKSLGQHFLTDPRILRKIAAAAELSRDDTVLEIGPGAGTLTEALLARAGNVIAVEKDERLCAMLKRKFAGRKNCRLICGDILQCNPRDYSLAPRRYKIIANIPYYLTGRILRLICTAWPRPSLAVLMLQKEVAERIIAKPPRMNRLAALIQYSSSPEIVAIVRKGSFTPPPKVDSAIIALRDIRPPKATDSLVEATIIAGFRQPRKFLATNLGKRFGRKKVSRALYALSLPPTARPAELTIAAWERLSTLLFKKG